MSKAQPVDHEDRINNILSYGGTAEVTTPENFVVDSWRRCVDQFGLMPRSQPDVEILESGAVRRLRDEFGEFIQVADEECRKLYRQTSQSGYVIVLTNTSGVILSLVCDPALDDVFRRYHLQPGAVWNEQRQGTNGMGTCLHARRPVIIHRDDHFFNGYRELTCTAAPICDPQGEIMAVLDASSFHAEGSKRGQIHTRALVQMAANFIEYKYFQRFFKDATLLSFHPRSEFLGVGTEALLALDEEGRIVGANARALGHLEFEERQQLIDCRIEEIVSISPVDEDNATLKRKHGIASVQDLRNGRRFLAMQHSISNPATRRLRKTNSRSHITVPPSDRQDCLDLKSLSGNDPHMAYNVRCVHRVVNRNIYILLTGETGTGKEVFARAAHAASDRRDKPFVALNCAAIPESLIESELFGYKAGAFTGARREGMRGCVLESSGGTLFLDEIGDMPLHLQTRLLRVLETKEVLPLGTQTPVEVDLHVISASNRDLREQIHYGNFREDLYYRLNGINLTLPPLRERQDLDSLMRCVLSLENNEKEPVSIERKAFTRFVEYSWPGNIRQLRNVIRTSLALSDDKLIRLADLPKEIAMPNDFVPVAEDQHASAEQLEDGAQHTPLEIAEREAILLETEHNRWNMTLTAKKLHMSRSTLYRKLKKYDIPITPPQ